MFVIGVHNYGGLNHKLKILEKQVFLTPVCQMLEFPYPICYTLNQNKSRREYIMKKQSHRSKDVVCLTVLYVSYIFALLIASSFTSPLYKHFPGDDSALFSLLGKGILQGKILYADLFDHKGPIIFFINALGHLLGGYNGIFALQIIFGMISLTFLYYSAKMLDSANKTVQEYILYFVFVYIVFFYTFERGNLTEEYSQPFICAALYLFIKFATRCEDSACNLSHPPIYAFFYGVFLAVLAFLRMNNAVTICAGIFAIFVFLMYKKKYVNLLLNILAGLAGISLVSIPVCLYFWRNSALYDMIYATFLYNLNIVGDSGKQKLFDHLFKFSVLSLPIVISFVLFLMHIIQERKLHFLDILFGCILVFNIIMFGLANRFPHYFAVFVPVYLVFLFRYFHISKRKIVTYLVVVCTIVNLLHIGFYSAITIYYCHITDRAKTRYNSVQSITSTIPESERDSVIGYEVPVSYYVLGDIVPCYKYYTWQESWSLINPQILVDFIQWIRSEQPLWVLITPQEDNQDLVEILNQQYDLISKNELIVSYRLKESR